MIHKQNMIHFKVNHGSILIRYYKLHVIGIPL